MHGTGGQGGGGLEDHLLQLVVERDGAADDARRSSVRTSTSLMASSAALRTISSTGLVHRDVDPDTVPEKVADPTSGSISMR